MKLLKIYNSEFERERTEDMDLEMSSYNVSSHKTGWNKGVAVDKNGCKN